jgi:hypothetical protein
VLSETCAAGPLPRAEYAASILAVGGKGIAMLATGHRRALAGVTVVTLLSGLGLAAMVRPATATPSAATVEDLSFTTVQAMTSTTHKHLRIGVSLNQEGSSAFGSVTVSRKGAPEIHEWSFHPFAKGSFAFNTKTGKGLVKLGKQIEPYGKITLKLVATGKKRVTGCATDRAVSQSVKVRGVFLFDTHSTGKLRWGRAGSSKSVVLHGLSTISYQTASGKACGTPPPQACVSRVTWNVFKQLGSRNSIVLVGTISKATSVLFGERSVALTKPAGASRLDGVQLADKHMTFSVVAQKATVTIGAAGRVTGSATLTTGAAGDASSSPCGAASAHHMQTSTRWQAAYTNGKVPLTVHEEIEGSYRMPNQPLAASTFGVSIDQDVTS